MNDRRPIILDKNKDINKRTAYIYNHEISYIVDVNDISYWGDLAIITDSDGDIYTTSFTNVLIVEKRRRKDNEQQNS